MTTSCCKSLSVWVPNFWRSRWALTFYWLSNDSPFTWVHEQSNLSPRWFWWNGLIRAECLMPGVSNLAPRGPLSCSTYCSSNTNYTHLNQLIKVFRLTRHPCKCVEASWRSTLQDIGPPGAGVDTPALCWLLDALFEHYILGNDTKTKKNIGCYKFIGLLVPKKLCKSNARSEWICPYIRVSECWHWCLERPVYVHSIDISIYNSKLFSYIEKEERVF